MSEFRNWIAMSMIGTSLFFGSFDSLLYASDICPARFSYFFDSYEAKDPGLLPVTVGIELEGALPFHRDLSRLAGTVQRQISKSYPNAQYRGDRTRDKHLIEYTRLDGQQKKWFIVPEESVETAGRGAEMISPILDTEEDFKSFNQVVQTVVQDLKIDHVPFSAGVHVHVGFGSPEVGEIAVMSATFKKIETELYQVFSTHPSRADMAAPVSDALLDLLLHAKLEKEGVLKQMIQSQDRQHALNLHALSKHGTLEFRLFNSTFDLEAIELMHDFSSRLVQAVRTKNSALVKYLTEEVGEIQFSEISKILDLKLARPEAILVLERIAKEAKPREFAGYRSNLAVILSVGVISHSIYSRAERLVRDAESSFEEKASSALH